MSAVSCQKPCLATANVGDISYMVLRGSSLDDTSYVQGD
jgi:hypothetical protein